MAKEDVRRGWREICKKGWNGRMEDIWEAREIKIIR